MAQINFAENSHKIVKPNYSKLMNHLKSDEKIKLAHQRTLNAKDRRYANTKEKDEPQFQHKKHRITLEIPETAKNRKENKSFEGTSKSPQDSNF